MKYILFVILFCGFVGCKRNPLEREIRMHIGKEIVIDSLNLFSFDTIAYKSMFSKPLKLIVYTDSASCSVCQMRLPEWRIKIRELNKYQNSIEVIFIVNTSQCEIIRENARMVGLKNTILYDTTNLFKKNNELSENLKLHTFLLNEENHIILIGSPINNDKMWDMYKETIKMKL